jgi:hypothetical protein
MKPRAQDIIFSAGGDVLERFGVFVQRTSPGEDVPETFTRSSIAGYRDRAGAMRAAAANVPRPEMLDPDGDGEYDVPSLLLGADDTFAYPFVVRPQRALSIYVYYEERGVGGGILHIGSAAGTGARLQVADTAGTIAATHHNGTTSVSSTLAQQANLGDQVELLVTFDEDGAVQIQRRVNGGSIETAAASDDLEAADEWDDELIYVNSLGSSTKGERAYRRLQVVLGSYTMDDLAGELSGVAIATRVYPAQHASGVWGWTETPGEAAGIVERVDGVVGVDSSTTVGGGIVYDIRGMKVAVFTQAAPTVSISSPSNGGSMYEMGSTLVGVAADAEGGNLSASIVWTSHLDGALGIGASISPAFTTLGVHVVTATITDAAGAIAQARVYVTVTSILGRAVAYAKASSYIGYGSWLDESGGGYHAKRGAGTARPIWLGPTITTTHLYCPGVAANVATVPDAAALDIAGNIEIRFDFAPDVIANGGSNRGIIGKYRSGTNQGAYAVDITATGVLELIVTPDGTAGSARTAACTAALTTVVSDGQRVSIKITRDSATGDVKFYWATSIDGTYTQLGTTVSTSACAIFNSTENVAIGSYNSVVAGVAGAYFKARLYDGIGGTKVLDVDFTDLTTYNSARTSQTAVTSQTVTIARSGTGLQTRVVESLGYHVYLPGIAGNYATTPDAAALHVTGDLTIDFYGAMDSWILAASDYALVARYTGNAAVSAYMLYMSSTGVPQLYLSDGAAIDSVAADSAVPFGAGAKGWIRATYRVSDRRVQFFYSYDGSSWTQIGADKTQTRTAITAGTAALHVGAWNTSGSNNPALGRAFRARVYASINDTSKVLDIDFSDTAAYDATRDTMVCSTGQTVTINRASSGLKAAVADGPRFLFGTSRYFEIADAPALDVGASAPFTSCVLMRRYGAFGTEAVMSKWGGGGVAGREIYTGAPHVLHAILSDATNLPDDAAAAAAPTGTDFLASARRSITDVKVYAQVDGGAETGVADTTSASSLANSNTIRIGASAAGAPSAFLAAETVGIAFFAADLTSAEQARVKLRLAA